MMVGDGGSTQGSKQRLNMNDALAYVQAVKEMFCDKRDKYDEFLKVLDEFTDRRLDPVGVASRVKELFKGHPNLISGFNAFLPERYTMTLPLEDEQPLAKKALEKALSLIKNVKLRFQGDEHVFKSFLYILKHYKEKNRTISEVDEEVGLLFQDHQDLIVEFTNILLDTSVAASADSAMHGQEIAFCLKVKERLHNSDECDDYQGFLKCLHKYKREIITEEELHSLVHDILGNHPDLIDEFVMHCENTDGFLDSVTSQKS